VGQRFADADLDAEKALFRQIASSRSRSSGTIVRELETSPTHTLEAERVLDDLEHSFSSEEARRQFETVIDWGRYAELLSMTTARVSYASMRSTACRSYRPS